MNLVLTVFAPFFPNGRITMYLLLLPGRVFCNWLCSAVIPSRRSSSSPTQIPTTAACGVISTLTTKQSVCSTIICRLRKSAATSANWKKELRADDTDRAERAALTLADGLHENFKKRAAQAEHINQLISASPYPTLVCGDFNSLPSSYVYQTVKGEKLNDGFQTCGHGYMYTFRYFKHLLRIDYILHSSEFQGVDYFSPDLEYSDHNPVVMRMRL